MASPIHIPTAFERMYARGQIIEVWRCTSEVYLPNPRVLGLGIRDLNGGHAIVIMGKAIVMTFVPRTVMMPANAPENERPIWAAATVQNSLDSMREAIAANADMFPPSTTKTWGIFEMGKGDLAGEANPLVTQVRSELARCNCNLSLNTSFYYLDPPERLPHHAGRDEVICYFDQYGDPTLWHGTMRLWPDHPCSRLAPLLIREDEEA